MAAAWRALVLVVGLAVMACVAQYRPDYESLATEAVQLFNQGRRGQSLFRLLEVTPPPTLNSTTKIPLSFTIKETVCTFNRRRQPQECTFKDGGEVRNCLGIAVLLGQILVLQVNCPRDSQLQPSEAHRVRRDAENAVSDIDSSKLPPVVRDIYEKAKFDIISNILSNF